MISEEPAMKQSDNYNAKFDLWAANPKVHGIPRIELPPFRSKKFNSYDEMNTWKRELLEKLAQNPDPQWTK